jgi:hypothetical protein
MPTFGLLTGHFLSSAYFGELFWDDSLVFEVGLGLSQG